jgi:DNA-binding transcriptional MerR regulator/cyclopropane fatty-acyl-phospholipid synthase-like methyltransferase
MESCRITELGRRFGLSRSTLLYYDRIGLLPPSGRSGADYRLYSGADADRLERILFYREAGLSLPEIARLLAKGGDDNAILEGRLREIGREVAALRSRQRIIARMLGTAVSGPEAAGLDRELWSSLQKVCGLDAEALRRWHAEFERRAPDAHHGFLLNLGLSEKEALQVRMLTRNVEDNTMKMKYFFEVFEDLPRQGPGCREATLKALGLLADLPATPKVLDIGCGCGMQTLILAEELKTRILAIDNHRPMLDRLERTAAREGLDIETRELSMIDMPLARESFDLLWAEGSIFIIGLARGLADFRTYLKPGGYLAFTEMCWFESEPPAEIKAYFDSVYPDIKSVEEVRQMAADSGYAAIENFNLPDSAWWEDYYTPMLARIAELKSRNAGLAEAEAVYAECETEVEMFRRHSKSYGYTFFVLRKP